LGLVSGLLDDDFVITTAGWLEAPAGRADWIREVEARHELLEFSIESIVEHCFDDVRIALVLTKQMVICTGNGRSSASGTPTSGAVPVTGGSF
jgi:hypothetical protein